MVNGHAMRSVLIVALAVVASAALGLRCGGGGGDPCAGVECSSRGFCIADQGSAYCGCISGYRPEDLTCVPIDPADPCAGIDCSDHGTCHAAGADPACSCDTGFHLLTEDDPRCADLACDLICVPDHRTDGGSDADADADVRTDADAVADDADAPAEAEADAGADADADADVPACEPVTCDTDCRGGGFLGGDCVGDTCVCDTGADADADADADVDACAPPTCWELGYECGFPPNPCGGVLSCGDACVAPDWCGGGGIEYRCGSPPDFTAPTITIDAIPDPAPSDYNATATVSFTWTCTDTGSGCASGSQTCTVDGSAAGVTCNWLAGSVAVGAAGSFAFGQHMLVVTARDVAGNTGTGTQTFTVTRCAGDMQFPNRRSNGFLRGNCCAGLEESYWHDFMMGFWHARGDSSCRPHSDYLSHEFETMWGAGGCETGQTTYDLLQGAALPGCVGFIARSICLRDVAAAQLYCGTDGDSGTQTPWHGRAGEGWHPPAAAGCESGVMSSSLMMERLGATDVCFTSVDGGTARMSVYPADACGAGLSHYCRSPEGTLVDDPPLCVCNGSDPYANDGRG
jgi:hypothetical protein